MSGWQLHPRLEADTVAIAELPLCALRLMRDARYPWLILVPRLAGAEEIVDLAPDLRHQLIEEIAATSRVLRAQFRPDKLNVAALGNQVPQLHVHVIARRRDDAAWPRPVWGAADPLPYAPDSLAERVALLQAAFATDRPSPAPSGTRGQT